MLTFIKTIGLSLFVVMLLVQPAYAYLDPGTGSFILQMIIAGVMGALFTIKMYWYRLKAFIAKLMGKEIAVPDDEEDDDDTVDKQNRE